MTGSSKGARGVISIRGKTIETEEREIVHSKLLFYVDNPRVYSIVHMGDHEPTQEEIQVKMQEMEYVKELAIDIRRDGGLTDPLVVKKGTFEVIEGNSRLAAWRLLASKDPVKWDRVRCVLLPEKTEQWLISALLGQWHLKGKKEWPAFEQAGYLYRRHREDRVAIKDLQHEVGLKIGRVKQSVEAYEMMVRHNDSQRDHYSYFLEYVKSRKIGAARKVFDKLDQVVVEQIKNDEIVRAQDLRDKLPIVCENRKVLRRYIRGDFPLDEAHEHSVSSGGGHSAFKKIKRFKTWLADADRMHELLEAKDPIRDRIKYEINKLKKVVDRLDKRFSK